jgi:hypothetical protein
MVHLFGDVCCWGVVLQKSFEGDERNFLGPLMRFVRRDGEEGGHLFARHAAIGVRMFDPTSIGIRPTR